MKVSPISKVLKFAFRGRDQNLFSREDEGQDEDGAQRSLTAKKLTTDEVKLNLFNLRGLFCSHKPTPRNKELTAQEHRQVSRHRLSQSGEMNAVTSLGVAQRKA